MNITCVCGAAFAVCWASSIPSISGITMSDSSRRSEEHTSELQSLMRISYAVFCLKKKKKTKDEHEHRHTLQLTKQRNSGTTTVHDTQTDTSHSIHKEILTTST